MKIPILYTQNIKTAFWIFGFIIPRLTAPAGIKASCWCCSDIKMWIIIDAGTMKIDRLVSKTTTKGDLEDLGFVIDAFSQLFIELV